jgi:NADH-quinone oxidoreductase subunit C
MTATPLDTLVEALAAAGMAAEISHGTLVVPAPANTVAERVATLKASLGFDMLLDVTAIDWPQRTPRFDVVWHFYSTVQHVRLRLKSPVPEADPAVPSLISLYGSAGIMERECHDMYGIRFEGNADMRPILLYEGFVGHPLRKDYPKDREQPLVPYRTR